MGRQKHFLLASLVMALASSATWAGEAVTPLTRAHSHNDYDRRRPLLDALDNGFCSVEADIYLVDGKLLVAHDRAKVRPGRTLQSMYLDPLRDRVLANGGRVYRNGPTVQLLIDIKTEAGPTWQALKQVLDQYKSILTAYEDGNVREGAITIIISGNRPSQIMAEEKVRYAALDGRPEDLDANPPAPLVPAISASWSTLFKWRGTGPFPEDEKQKLRQLVSRTHEQGRKLRLWAAPDAPAGWQELLDARVDWINTDRPAELRAFLLKHRSADAAGR